MSQQQSQIPFGAARSFSLMPILVGVVIGLVVGLFLGWRVWPVQWSDAWPSDLTDEAKAQYLAAVAQVYAYYPDDRAAEIARSRLYDLEPNIEEEIAAAQTYFAENPLRDSNVYITMLTELAAGLGVASDAPALATVPDAQTAADATAASDGPSWMRWIFSSLLVLLLLGGGIYILSRLAASRRKNNSGSSGTLPQDGYVSPQPASGPRSSRGGSDAPPDDYRFDQEPDDGIVFTPGSEVVAGEEPDDDTYFGDESAAGYAQSASGSASAYADSYSGPYAESDRSPYMRPSAAATQVYEPDIQEEILEDEFVSEEMYAGNYDEADDRAGNVVYDEAYEEVYEQSSARQQRHQEAVVDETVVEKTAAEQAAVGKQVAASAPVQEQPAAMLSTYIVQYEAGVPEYEQSHNILDSTGRYIGECGMGVNMKNGILQDVPENVIALDVWLFDQRHDRSLGNQTRVLLSEYAVDNGLEPTFVRERPDGPAPVVAQPGVSFKLKGENMDVDCEILEAEYAGDDSNQPAGVFLNVRIEMTVRSRT